ncbi:kiSS-1 receptor-like [Lytechinus pictus]|uniref:kiSS-1 receptor-like n=1 Tax=Lytechinus pictus TaxID=7653 RepID=UPI0030B9FF62
MASDADLTCIPLENGASDLNTTTGNCLNNSGSELDYPDYFQMNETASMVMKTLPRIVMILIAITGLTGNSVVLYIIIKHRDMRTVTNYFVANLAITDITFLILCVIPTVIVIGGMPWPLGGFMCRINSYFQYVSHM